MVPVPLNLQFHGKLHAKFISKLVFLGFNSPSPLQSLLFSEKNPKEPE